MHASTAPAAKALTIKQPWAFAIAEGFKTAENRSRRTNYCGTVWIHAGQTHDWSVSIARYSGPAAIRLDELGGSGNFWDARTLVSSRIVKAPPTSLALSAVIATARLAGCHQAADDCCPPWGFPGQWHWELADVRLLPAAVACRGQLGLWRPPAEVLAAVEGQQPAEAA